MEATGIDRIRQDKFTDPAVRYDSLLPYNRGALTLQTHAEARRGPPYLNGTNNGGWPSVSA